MGIETNYTSRMGSVKISKGLTLTLTEKDITKAAMNSLEQAIVFEGKKYSYADLLVYLLQKGVITLDDIKGMTPEQIQKYLKVLAIFDKDSKGDLVSKKTNLAKVKDIAKYAAMNDGVKLDEISTSLENDKIKTDSTLDKLAKAYDKDAAQFTTNAQALKDLSGFHDAAAIRGNKAYIAYTAPGSNLSNLTEANKKIVEEANGKVKEAERAAAETQNIAGLKKSVGKASSLDALSAIVKKDAPSFAGNEELRKAVGERALVIIKGYTSSVARLEIDALNDLAGFINSGENQRIIPFNNDGKDFVIPIEKKDGKWVFAGGKDSIELGGKTYEVVSRGEENDHPIIEQHGFLGRNSSVTSQGTLGEARYGAVIRRNGDWTTIRTAHGVELTFHDINHDGRMGKNERAGATIKVNGSHGEPITIQLFNLIDRDMDANKEVDGDSAGEITSNEMEDFEAGLMLYHEAINGDKHQITLEDALAAYTAKDATFSNKNLRAVIEMRKALAPDLSGLPLTQGSDPGKFLTDKKFDKIIARAIVAYIQSRGAGQTTEKDVAAFLARVALAMMSGVYIGIDDGAKKIIDEMESRLYNRDVTRSDLLDWFKGKLETTKENGGSGSSEAKQRALQELQSSDNVDAAEKIYNKNSGKLANHDGANKFMAQKYLEKANSDPAALAKALEYINKMANSEDKQQLFAQLILKAVDIDQEKAKEYLTQFKALSIVNGAKIQIQERGNSVDKDQFIQYVETQLEMPKEGMSMQRKWFTRGEKGEENPNTQGRTIADLTADLATLDGSIAKANGAAKAHLLSLKAKLLTIKGEQAAAGNWGLETKKQNSYYEEALKMFKSAAEEFGKIADSKGDTQKQQVHQSMAQVFGKVLEKYSTCKSAKDGALKKEAPDLKKTIEAWVKAYAPDASGAKIPFPQNGTEFSKNYINDLVKRIDAQGSGGGPESGKPR